MIKYYAPYNEKFEKNGTAILRPASCDIHAVLNGEWALTLEQPYDDRSGNIVEQGVLKVPTWNGEQLYRIKNLVKSESDLTAKAEPIFLDALNDCILTDVRPENLTGQDALNLMITNPKYSGQSDILAINSAVYEYKNLIEALNGSEDNAFVNRWGGKIIYDNYNIVINERAGNDYNVELLYGKNITGITYEVDVQDLATRIIPKSYNGYMLDGDAPWVDSPHIYDYPIIYTRVMEFNNVKMAEDAKETDEGEIICNTLAELQEALQKQCELQYEAGVDQPQINLSVDAAAVDKTNTYAFLDMNEKIALGDTIHIRYNPLNIITEADCIEINYDCLAQKTTNYVIGNFLYSYWR